MNRKIRSTRWHKALRTLPVLFLLIASLAIASLAFVSYRPGVTPGVVNAATSPAIVSDKADYPPGATVTLTGAGWQAGETVQIYVNDNVGNTWSLTSGQNGAAPSPQADGTGAFTYSFSLPTTFVASYAVTATGSTGDSATTTFTDGNVNLDQFANGQLGTGTGQGWQNGSLNGNNSHYQEGKVVPFRLDITGLSSGTHTIHLNYDFTAGGHEAYDFLASYNATESPDVCSTVATNSNAGICPVGTPNTLAFPADPFAPGGQTAAGETVNGAIAFAGQPRQLSMWGGNPVNFSSVTHTGPTSGDSSADLLLTFSTSNCTPNPCEVLLAWGGHLAQSAYWTTTTGGPNGAGQISGAPFHMRTQKLDGTGGNANQDRSIQPSAIVTTLTVNKTLMPSTDSGQFNLLINGTTDATNVGNGGTTGPQIITPGSNTVSETAGTNTILNSYSSTVSCVNPQGTVVASGTGTSLSVNVISGINVTCTFTNTRLNKDLIVTKTATPAFTRTYNWSISKTVDSTAQNIAAGGSATFNYAVSVTHDSGRDSGWTLTGTINVTNPNAVAFTGVNVTDNNTSCSVANATNVTIPANGSATLDYSCTFTSNPGSGTNTATATWDKATYNTPDPSAKSDPVSFAFTTPTTIVDGSVSVNDTLGGPLGTVSYTDPSPTKFPYPYTFSSDPAGTCTKHPNTATFKTNTTGTTGSASQSVQVCVGVDLKVSKTATPSFTRTYTWSISKSVDQTTQTIAADGKATFNYTVEVTHDGGTDSNWTAKGTISVANPNEFESISGIQVTDAVDNGGTCTVDTNGFNGTLGASASVTLSYSCTYISAPSPSSGTNTATVTWNKAAASTPSDTATGTAGVDFGTATVTVHNGTITVVDDKTDPTNPNPVTLGPASYTQDNPIDFTYQLPLSGRGGTCSDYTNTATIKGTTQTASQTVTVCAAVDLTVSKTANPAFTRTYTWGITKSVDKTLVEQIGGTATFNYTVSVTHDKGTDGNWQVKGHITVTNPNDWEDIKADVTDAIDNGGSCTVNGGTGVTVPKSSWVTLDYTCTYASTPSKSSGTNTATAKWDPSAFYTPNPSAQGTANLDFGSVSPELVDDSVTVTDPNAPNPPLPATVSAATDPSPKTFTYAKSVNVPTSGCVFVNNTATFKTNTTGTTGSASQKVEVCGPAQTGALTMGFWQNKNGQTIIQKYSGTNCQALATWLEQFQPFSDLSSYTTCGSSPSLGATSATGVVGYVYNVIKTATCTSTIQTCNAMLKAQMLATALDVYFSDPALGGNKISAPAPIGGVKIDLTHVSSAFGGATSLTVSEMLTYAASQSNLGGSTWYGNVKATQVLAKDAFDAINNQVAFAP